MKPDEYGELTLVALHPGKKTDEIQENTGWEIKISDNLRVTEPPKGEELRILRQELDPTGIYI
jgi:glutaconate CoA-transferase subunit B